MISVLDIETTGTNPDTDAIVEIAAIDIGRSQTGYRANNPRTFMVNPGRPIPPEASAVHHLTNEDVEDAQWLSQVIDQFKGATAYIAHNAAFERSFLECWGISPFICTYRAALRVWPDAPGHSNQVLRYWLGHVDPLGKFRDAINPHRALSDCYVTGAIFISLLQSGARWPDLLAWSSEPPLHERFTFGKHKGARYDAVPADYLDWIVNRSDMDADTKWCAAYWLNRRRQAT